MRHIDWRKLILSIGFTFSAALIGNLFTIEVVRTWYVTLNKPWFSPPNWVFGPVWTTLYVMMGVSLYLVWNLKKKSQERRLGLTYFCIQLMLNTLWSILFFGLKSPFLGLLEIISLLIAIYFTIEHFYRVSKPAAYLLYPYILWVSFATILNLAIVWMNR